MLGGYEEDGQVFSASIATEPKLTRDDYACKLQQVLLPVSYTHLLLHGIRHPAAVIGDEHHGARLEVARFGAEQAAGLDLSLIHI